jgi:hypothetical protein
MDRIEQATAAPGEYRAAAPSLSVWKAAAELLELCDGDIEKAIALLKALR